MTAAASLETPPRVVLIVPPAHGAVGSVLDAVDPSSVLTSDEALQFERVTAAAAAELLRAARAAGASPALIVLAPGALAWQRDVARRVRQLAPGVPIAFVAPRDAVDAAQRALAFEPCLGQEATVVPYSTVTDLRGRLEALVSATLRRRAHRAALGRVNAEIARARDGAAERQRLEVALRDREDRLRLAVEATGLGTWEYVLHEGSWRLDDRCRALLGLPDEGALARDEPRTNLPDEDRARVLAALARALEPASDGVFATEFRVALTPADERWCAAKGRAFAEAEGAPTRVVGTVVDVSERRALLARAQAAQATAEAANGLKDEFLATLSHELRTPLTAILGWARMLRSGSVAASKIAHALETIERNAQMQVQLVEDVLDISRIVSGKLRLAVAPVAMGAVIDAALATIALAADAKGVRLESTLEAHRAVVLGDAARLQQVVWNLLSNAVKFTPRGGRVTVNLRCPASHVEVEVRDSGQGIRPDFLPYVFDRFRQADGSSTRMHGGLGLGLAIVRQVVELHGGQVRAQSAGEGHGATFTVRLPLAPVRASAVEAAHRSSVAATLEPSAFECPAALQELRVVVVDDEPDTRDLIAVILTRCGAHVTLAATAAEAFARIESTRPDLLVSDIGLPGEDGYTLIRRVRALSPEQGGRTPAVALTAFARSEDRSRALRAGFNHYLAKPVEPNELVRVLAAATGRAAAR